ncbi:unnamed protein product [Amoebophrya sp. A120]|nr:unnamed protein product [Amoebophrya sp. A120]|eukprot:GSA120T00011330001.1
MRLISARARALCAASAGLTALADEVTLAGVGTSADIEIEHERGAGDTFSPVPPHAFRNTKVNDAAVCLARKTPLLQIFDKMIEPDLASSSQLDAMECSIVEQRIKRAGGDTDNDGKISQDEEKAFCSRATATALEAGGSAGDVPGSFLEIEQKEQMTSFLKRLCDGFSSVCGSCDEVADEGAGEVRVDATQGKKEGGSRKEWKKPDVRADFTAGKLFLNDEDVVGEVWAARKRTCPEISKPVAFKWDEDFFQRKQDEPMKCNWTWAGDFSDEKLDEWIGNLQKVIDASEVLEWGKPAENRRQLTDKARKWVKRAMGLKFEIEIYKQYKNKQGLFRELAREESES